MDQTLPIFLGAAIGALGAYITTRVTTKNQLNIAHINAEKDIILQKGRLKDEREKNEISLKRTKLDILHRTLSKISLENSLTMSYMQSDEKWNVSDFRKRYLENCDRLHAAMAISDIYYPQMSTSLKRIYDQTNIFWGYQENLLRTDIKTNKIAWQENLSNVLKAGSEIEEKSLKIKEDIIEQSKHLSKIIED